MSHYETLGIEPTATEDEIRVAYRFAARKHHPDLGGDPAKMAAVNQAYEVLSDAERRARYDATGESQAEQTLELKAREVLMQLLNAALADQVDLLANVRQRIKASVSNAENAIRSGSAEIARLQTRRGRIKCASGVNLVHALIDQKVGEISRRVEDAREAVQVFGAAEEMLAGYTSDEAQSVTIEQGMRGFVHTNGTGAGAGTGWLKFR